MTSVNPRYLNELGLPEPPLAGNEADSLLGALERQRNTLAWKCRGVDAAGMRVTVGASSITLGGLLKHLAMAEAEKFDWMLRGVKLGPPWNTVAWDADPDWPWHSASDDSPDELMQLWQGAIAHSREVTEEALAGDGLDTPTHFATEEGEHANLRRLIVDLVEEYARHTGHADLIRESIDGLVGEDPPPGTPVP
jgi:hypothetical protein